MLFVLLLYCNAQKEEQQQHKGGRAEGNRNSTTAVIKKYLCPLGAVSL